MLDIKQFVSAMHQIAEEKGIPEAKVMETIDMAIAAAYKRDFGQKGQIIQAHLDQETGAVSVERVQIVVEGVDEEGYIIGDVPESEFVPKPKINEDGTEGESDELVRPKFNPEKHITLEDAKEIKKTAKVGDELVSKLESKTEFGRIAAQTAKQVIIQRLREIEREATYAEFKDKESEVISGIVQRVEGRVVHIDLGRTSGIMPPSEQVFSERYRIGQRMKFFLVKVEESNRGPAIILSRSHPRLVTRLFEFEVPELEAGSVEIKAIAREAGSRSKVAVESHEDGVDPIGSLVGQRGVRVQTVINELGGEKIDIIEYSDDPKTFIAKALAPAKVMEVVVGDEEQRHAVAHVADDQFSLAIGKQGQNVRLAAKLTNWKIDVRSPQENLTAAEVLEGGDKEPDQDAVEDTAVEKTETDEVSEQEQPQEAAETPEETTEANA